MAFNLSGVAFITGAGGALGQAISLQFARDGVTKIAGLDISAASLDSTAAELSKEFPLVEFLKIPIDLTKEADFAKAIETTITKFGRIDYAVNNAAVGQRVLVPSSEASLEDFDKVMSVNLRGVFICEKYELKQMAIQQPLIPKNHSPLRPPSRGVIVNVSSTMGLLTIPNLSLYTSSKHAVLGLTKADALDYAQKQIRVNAVCPGFIDTPLLTESNRKAMAKNITKTAQGRLANPQEVADGVIFLASDRASHITGTVLTVDGGYSIS